MRKYLSIIIMFIALTIQISALEIAGSSTVQPVVIAAGKVFTERTGEPVSVQGGGSSHGAQSAIDGIVDIGTCSRDLKQSEVDAGLRYFTIGLDGIAIIVNGENPITGLLTDQIIQIFTGEMDNWESLAGIDEEIVVVSKEAGRSTGELFEGFFNITDSIVENAFLIGSNIEDIAFIAGDPYAIGYVSIGSAELAIKQDVNIKLLDLDNIVASIDNVRNQSYPLRRVLNLVTLGDPNSIAREFIDFVLSDAGQRIVEANNFIRAR